MITADKNSLSYKLALFAVFAAFIVIGMGAFTRLVDAGLGCPDWPTCYGHVLWPDAADEINAANTRYDETPVEKHKTWPEQVHRLFASSLGLISLVIFALALRSSDDKKLNKKLIALVAILLISLITRIVLAAQWKITANAMHDFFDLTVAGIILFVFGIFAGIASERGRSKTPIILPAFIVCFVILQGLFGMWTVTLKVWPQVVTTHLLGGFAVVSLLWLLALRLQNKPWRLSAKAFSKITKLKRLGLIALLVVVVQIALGGWTTSNYAAVACPELPTCQNQWWPEMDFAKGFDISQGIGPNYLGGKMDNSARMAIHMSHRIGAIITTAILIFVSLCLFQVKSRETKIMAYSVLAVLSLQVLLGLSNVIFHFPVHIAVAHNGVGALLLLTMVTLNYRLRTAQLVELNHE